MIQINCECKEFLSIDELTEFQGELKHREQSDVEKIIKSIKKHGFCFPFFVWKHDGINHVFDGHGRLLALKYLKSKGEDIPALPVVYVNAKNEAEAKELLLKLNSNYGHMTQESVLEFLDGIEIDFSDIQLPDTTMSFDMDNEPEETENDDEVPEVKEEAVSQPGEMYELGNSILICGDSLNPKTYRHLMGGDKAVLCFTDPPYGMKKEKDGVANDNLNYDDLLEFNKKWIPLSLESLTDVGSWYCWGIDEPLMDIYSNILKPLQKENKITFRNLLTWNKGSAQGQLSEELRMYPRADEKCLFIMKDVQGLNTNRAYFDNVHDNQNNVWTFPRCVGKEREEAGGHATPKPLKLVERAILSSSRENDIVLDCFGGSGSTLIACEKLNRKCRMIELAPLWCDVIRRRYTKWAKENGRPITSGCLE